MKPGPARLLFPALRWNDARGFDDEQLLVEQALRRGVGGFIIFGGAADAARQLIEVTQSRCDYALLFGSDLERGAGQQFDGATRLPPLAAIGALDSTDITRRAATITATEARDIGINWIFAPDADLDIEPRNPIVGTRSLGSQPARVAPHVESWIAGCHEGGALACAKHFPGHGRTTDDSHALLPRVSASVAELDKDLEPFVAAIRAGVDAIMTAHVVYENYDATTAATVSHRIVTELLRNTLRFEGLVVTDGMGMQGLLDACDGDEAAAGITAVNAGCDVLLYPTDFVRVADALEAEKTRTLSPRRVDEARERIVAAADQAHGFTRKAASSGSADNAIWAGRTALASLQSLRDSIDVARRFDLITIDDDVGGPFPPPSREHFVTALRAHGLDPVPVDVASVESPLMIAVYADIRAWKGAPGISSGALKRVETAMRIRSDAVIILFGHPRLAETLPGGRILGAWGGEEIMQRAAAAWLADANSR